MSKKLIKTIVIDEKEWKLNIFVERRNSVRCSFVNNGINIRLPRHLSTEEKNKAGKELLEWAVKKIKSEPEKFSEKIYSHGDEIKTFGRRYMIHIERHLKTKNFTKEDGDFVKFRIADHYDDEKIQNYIRKQIRNILARNHLDELIEEVHYINNKYLQKSLGEISIKHTTSRWGQCHTRRGDIDFSTRLLLAPLPVIRYVILHELTHLIHADHSKRFWEAIASVDPNYKDKVKWLKKFGHTLTL
jgi:predicted metal-dependent hydrolase